jgi:hypothetical protein
MGPTLTRRASGRKEKVSAMHQTAKLATSSSVGTFAISDVGVADAPLHRLFEEAARAVRAVLVVPEHLGVGVVAAAGDVRAPGEGVTDQHHVVGVE